MRSARVALFFPLLVLALLTSCARGTAGSNVDELDELDDLTDSSTTQPPPKGTRLDSGTDSDSDDEDDVTTDVGSVAKDSGPPQMAPPQGGLTDAALPRDAGAAAIDAGPMVVVMDAGPRDTGAPVVRDTGTPPPPVEDAGQPTEPAPADAGSVCAPGTYRGAFAGDISALLGLVKREVSGTISIEIALSGTADRLEIRNGALSGKDEMGYPVKAVVSGTLNCTTKKLENGRLTDGVYEGVDALTRRPTTTRFSGTTTANYLNDPPSAAGRWDVQNRQGTRGGEGTWSAQLVR